MPIKALTIRIREICALQSQCPAYGGGPMRICGYGMLRAHPDVSVTTTLVVSRPVAESCRVPLRGRWQLRSRGSA
jgi:hypothetical protein